MLKDVPSVLMEMAFGFVWPINAPLDWVIQNWRVKEWIRVFEVSAVAVALAVFVIEFQVDRPRDRAVRVATLFAQIAQTHALPNHGGMHGLKPSIEALASERVPMPGINLSKVNLRNVNLREIDLDGANLGGTNLGAANLSRVTLRWANLEGAILHGADLSEAVLEPTILRKSDLRGVNFTNARISGTSFETAELGCISRPDIPSSCTDFSDAILTSVDFRGVDLAQINLSGTSLQGTRGLTQDQLDSACADLGNPPKNLPAGLKPPTKICPKQVR